MSELKRQNAESAPKKKRWALRIIVAVVSALILLVCLEAGLRVGGYGFVPDIAVKQDVNGKLKYCYNTKLGYWFFPKTKDREFSPFAFDIKKDPRTYRVFVLGASAAQGWPDPVYNFGRILEIMLENDYSGTDFEVINVGMRDINSDAVYQIAKSCVKHEPDLMIVCPGDRETAAGAASGLWMVRARTALASTRVGQLFGLRAGESHNFEKSIRDICEIGVNAGASVILSAPIGVSDRMRGTVSEIAREAGENVRAVNAPEDDFLLYGKGLPRFEGNFKLALMMRNAVGNILSQEITRYATKEEPLDMDACEERLMYTDFERYRSAMRALAVLNQSAASTTEAESIDRIERESESLRENVQSTLNSLLPRYKEMIEAHPDDWRLSWKVAEYSDRYFRNPGLAEMQAKKVLKQVPHDGAMRILMYTASRQGRLDEAEGYARKLIARNSGNAGYYFDMGEIYQKRGEYEDAIKWYGRGIKRQPTAESVVAYTYMAQLYEAIGQPKKAIKTLYEAIEDDPREHAAPAYVTLGLLLAQEDRADEAVKVLREAIEVFQSEDIPRRDEIIRLLKAQGQSQLARRLEEEPRMDSNERE